MDEFPQMHPQESLLAIARDDFFDAIELKGFGSAEAYLAGAPINVVNK